MSKRTQNIVIGLFIAALAVLVICIAVGSSNDSPAQTDVEWTQDHQVRFVNGCVSETVSTTQTAEEAHTYCHCVLLAMMERWDYGEARAVAQSGGGKEAYAPIFLGCMS